MTNDDSSYYECDEIKLNNGFNFLSKTKKSFFSGIENNTERLINATWPKSANSIEKEKITNLISKRQIKILSPEERIGDMFVFSIIYRFLTIGSLFIKGFIDSCNISQILKYALKFVVGVAPSLIMYHIFNYPILDMYINDFVNETVIILFAIIKPRLSEFILTADPLFHNYSFKTYLSKSLIRIIFDGSLLYFRLNNRSQEDFEDSDPSRLHYCNKPNSKSIRLLDHPSYNLTHYDLLFWNSGKFLGDLCFTGFFRLIKIVINYVKNVEKNPVNVTSQTNLEKEPNIHVKPFEYPMADPSLFHKINLGKEEILNDVSIEPSGEKSSKIKTRKENGQIIVPQEEIETPEPESIVIEDRTYHSISVSKNLSNGWGVIIDDKMITNKVKPFETSLGSGNLANKSSSIEHFHDNIYTVRPKETGKRLVGFLYNNIKDVPEKFKKTFENLQSHLQDQDFYLVIFKDLVKHSDLNKKYRNLKPANERY